MFLTDSSYEGFTTEFICGTEVWLCKCPGVVKIVELILGVESITLLTVEVATMLGGLTVGFIILGTVEFI